MCSTSTTTHPYFGTTPILGATPVLGDGPILVVGGCHYHPTHTSGPELINVLICFSPPNISLLTLGTLHTSMSLVSMPTKLEEITSQGVKQISCGRSHVLALSETGDVYAWGSGVCKLVDPPMCV